MPSVSNFQTALEGTLVTQISAAATTATVKVKKINGATPTWLTTAHRVTIIQKSRTVTKVEVVDVAAGTTQSGTTVTLGTMTRGLPLDGTGFTGSGTPQVFTSGAKVIVTWDAQAGRQTAFKDIANSFSANQTITSTNELRFADSATAIWDDGTNLSFKDSTTATKTLAQLSALSGSDEKVKITATDTTSSYLDDALLVTTPVVKTTNNGGANETITLSLDTIPVTKGGTGLTTTGTAYAPIFAGTTATGAFQAGTAGTANQVLTSNGAGAIATFQDAKYYEKIVYLGKTTSAEVGDSSTAEANFGTNSYTIPSGELINNVAYEVEAAGNFEWASGTLAIRLKLGSTQILRWTVTPAAAGKWTAKGTIYGTAAAGASANVVAHGILNMSNNSSETNSRLSVTELVTADAVTVATNGTLTLQLSAEFSASSSSNGAFLSFLKVRKISTSTFA